MSDEIRISGIVEESIVDGPGLRYVLFTQGCPHHCKGCHNPTTHPFDGGRMVSPDWVFADVRKNPIVRGVTFSGGEPFVQSGKLAPLAERLRAAGYNLTSYTGYLYEELLADSRHMPLLRQLDILVDGPFILEEKSLIIRFRGSRNQRIIDVPRSLAEGRVGLHPASTHSPPEISGGLFLCLESPSGGRGHPCWRNWYLYGYTVYAVIRVRRRAAPLVWVTR